MNNGVVVDKKPKPQTESAPTMKCVNNVATCATPISKVYIVMHGLSAFDWECGHTWDIERVFVRYDMAQEYLTSIGCVCRIEDGLLIWYLTNQADDRLISIYTIKTYDLY